MRTSLLKVFLILLSISAARAADVNVWMCIYGNAGYFFTATPEIIAKLPDWPLHVDEPPLAPRKAERVARKKLAEFFPDGRRWRIESITLQPFGGNIGEEKQWIYVCRFMERDIVSAGLPESIEIPVLMTGLVPPVRIERGAARPERKKSVEKAK